MSVRQGDLGKEFLKLYGDGLGQNRSNSIPNTVELSQPSIQFVLRDAKFWKLGK